MKRKQILVGLIGLFFVYMTVSSKFSIAGIEQEKDHISSTQSGVVLVTSELLNREGEPGPASPSFRMPDTSKFLVKKPYEGAEKLSMHELAQLEEESLNTSSDEWFLGEEDGENGSISEPIDKK